jgi:hypothetical protein
MKRTRKLGRGRKFWYLDLQEEKFCGCLLLVHEICLRSDGGVALVGQKLDVGSRILESLPFSYIYLVLSLL